VRSVPFFPDALSRWDGVISRGNFSFCVVEVFMLRKTMGYPPVWPPEQSFGVSGVEGMTTFKPGQWRKYDSSFANAGAQLVAPASRRPDDQRHLCLAAEH